MASQGIGGAVVEMTIGDRMVKVETSEYPAAFVGRYEYTLLVSEDEWNQIERIFIAASKPGYLPNGGTIAKPSFQDAVLSGVTTNISLDREEGSQSILFRGGVEDLGNIQGYGSVSLTAITASGSFSLGGASLGYPGSFDITANLTQGEYELIESIIISAAWSILDDQDPPRLQRVTREASVNITTAWADAVSNGVTLQNI
jgi:hypothetical protein